MLDWLWTYIDPNYSGPPFELFGPGHLFFLTLIGLASVQWFFWPPVDDRTRQRLRYTLATILLISESAWHLWNLAFGTWSLQRHLPLHLCSVLIWVTIYALFTDNRRLYELTYFLGLGGALQAVLTPEAGIYGFPHFRLLQTQTSHGMLVVTALYLVAIEGLRPDGAMVRRVIVTGLVYMGLVGLINIPLGSNYLYLMHKPDTASIMDLMPGWPGYIGVVLLIALVMIFIEYLPFWVRARLLERRKLDEAV